MRCLDDPTRDDEKDEMEEGDKKACRGVVWAGDQMMVG